MKVIVTGGGTGGHIYPALAIADKIKEKEPGAEILYVGCKAGIETEIVPKEGYDFVTVPARWIGPASNKFVKGLKMVRAGLVTSAGVVRAYGLMKKFKPDVVIGTGGFVCAPTIIAGKKYGAKCYLHEQNAFPGVTNRALEKWVKRVFLGFEMAADNFKCKEKLCYVSNPVRETFFHLDKDACREKLGIPKDDFMVFAFGGSLGAAKINEISVEYLKKVNGKPGYTFVFGTGKNQYEDVIKHIEDSGIEVKDNVKVLSYINGISDYIGAADLIMSRAGALSLAEITTAGKAAVLVPYPYAKDNHQYFNAKAVADKGGAILVEEKNLNPKETADRIFQLSLSKEKLFEMSKASKTCGTLDAAEMIYESIKSDF